MSTGPAADNTKGSCGSPPSQEEGRAGDNQPDRQQSEIGEALVVEQNTPRSFSSPAPSPVPVDPLSGQTILSSQNLPIPVVDDKGSAKLLLDNREYKWLGDVNGERMGMFISTPGNNVLRYPPQACHVFAEDELLRSSTTP